MGLFIQKIQVMRLVEPNMVNFYSKVPIEFNFHCEGCPAGRVSWWYNNTSDILVLKWEYDEHWVWGNHHDAYAKEEYMNAAEASALLQALTEWANA